MNKITDKTQVTFKMWADTHKALVKISEITNESMVLIVHRMVIAELKSLTERHQIN